MRSQSQKAKRSSLFERTGTFLADYMEELTTESVTIPEALLYYVDWQAMARDAEMGGDLFTIETAHGEVHVFSSR